jgi:hypothetical protein
VREIDIWVHARDQLESVSFVRLGKLPKRKLKLKKKLNNVNKNLKSFYQNTS